MNRQPQDLAFQPPRGAQALRHAAVALAVATLVATLGGCGNTPLQQGQAQLDQGDWRAGLATLQQAANARPTDAEARMVFMRQRDQVSNRLLAQATSDAAAGRFDTALAGYRQVLEFDPGNPRARDGQALIDMARRHRVLADDARARLERKDWIGAELAARAILAEDPNNATARDVARALQEREEQQAVTVPLIKSKLQNPVSLEFRDAPLRMVLEALSRSAGINFIIDREVRPDLKATIFVRNVRIEDAIDLIVQNNQLEKKVLNDSTMLIYPNTPQKQREHQELVIRTFQVGNADPKQTLNLLRTVLKSRDLYVDERTSLLIMRDTPDAIRAAEKLIAAQDTAEPEVVLELEILEVSRQKVRDIGLGFPTSFSGPTGTLAAITELHKNTIGADTGFSLKLLRTDGETKTLANPRMRIRNREKARVHVGDRVPVISSSVVGTSTGQAGSVPVTTEQIQYLDVGIKIEAEPTIYPDSSVAVKINLDVSTLGARTRTNAGTTAYQVGTRNATTVLRLRDGETQALMGLIRDDDSTEGAGLPFVGENPLLDRIAGSKKTDRRNTELVLLITPQVVRPVARMAAGNAEFWSGTEASLRIGSPFPQTVPDKPGAKPLAGASAPNATGGSTATLSANAAAVPAGAAAAPAASPVVAPAAAPAAATSANPAVPLLSGAAPPPPPPVVPLALSWKLPASVAPGTEFTMELRGKSDAAIKGASIQLRYDPDRIEVLSVTDGGYFGANTSVASFQPRIDAGIGIVFASVAANPNTSAQGEGALLTLRARAKPSNAPGKLQMQIASAVGVDTHSRQVPVQGTQPVDLGTNP
ncbi:type II secretory pathway, component HofQ [Burkholderiales bacterium JOSHI_001]|nr:type II secretory pathway, component HofQ [Burkholderiales bacterium JOSHI_001]